MKLGAKRLIERLLLISAGIVLAAGCATLGWGPAPANTGVPVTAQKGAPGKVQTTGMRLPTSEAQVTAPPWIRVQDCAIVAISTPSRYACPDGKVYTNFQLSRSRLDHVTPLPPPAPIVLAPPPPMQAEAAEKIVLRGVHFDFNKAEIRPQDAAVLDEAADTLKAHPNVSISVDGYCDAIGSVPYNQRLSQQRASAVVRYLSDKGVAASRLTPRGFGKADFVASNSTEEGRAQNRRVEMNPGASNRVFLMGVSSR